MEFSRACLEEFARTIQGGYMTNREWIDLLSKEFAVSRTSARDMLHALMTIKRYDNFKRVFDPLPEPYREDKYEQ